MFTGIVESTVPVTAVADIAEGRKLSLDLSVLSSPLVVGESIAVDGCCLTVESIDGATAHFHAGSETLSLTTLGERKAGDRVNVERALAMGDRLGGHMVSGHVDGVGTVTAIEHQSDQTVMHFELPQTVMNDVLLKGSLAIDGVSLTLASVDAEANLVSVALIPHTLLVTTLGTYSVGDGVNLEADMVGKWIRSMVAPILDEIRNDSQQ